MCIFIESCRYHLTNESFLKTQFLFQTIIWPWLSRTDLEIHDTAEYRLVLDAFVFAFDVASNHCLLSELIATRMIRDHILSPSTRNCSGFLSCTAVSLFGHLFYRSIFNEGLPWVGTHSDHSDATHREGHLIGLAQGRVLNIWSESAHFSPLTIFPVGTWVQSTRRVSMPSVPHVTEQLPHGVCGRHSYGVLCWHW